MDPTPQQPNPLAGLMAMFSQSPAPTAAPQQQAAPTQPVAVPSSGPGSAQPAPGPPMQQQPQQGMNPMIQSLMGQSQQAMNAPMGQAVPPAGGPIDALKHPLVAGFIKAIAQAAQSYGWTAMMPQEREERTQMQQQKAEALARLAETGTQYENINAWRQGQLGVSQENADTRQANEKSMEQNRLFTQQLNTSKNAWQQTRAQAQTDIQRGNLALGTQKLQEEYARLHQTASQFEQMFQIRSQQVGIEQAKLELGQQANDIRQEAVDVAKTLGTAKQETGASEWDRQHYLLSSVFGGVSEEVGNLLGTNRPAAPAGVATTQRPTPQSKAEAKNLNRQKPGGGPVTVDGFTFPNQQAADSYRRHMGGQ